MDEVELIEEIEDIFCRKCQNRDKCHIPCVTIMKYMIEKEEETNHDNSRENEQST